MNVDRLRMRRRHSTTAVQVKSVLTVSSVIVCASQPVGRSDTGRGWISQLTVTLVTYQPLAPCVP